MEHGSPNVSMNRLRSSISSTVNPRLCSSIRSASFCMAEPHREDREEQCWSRQCCDRWSIQQAEHQECNLPVRREGGNTSERRQKCQTPDKRRRFKRSKALTDPKAEMILRRSQIMLGHVQNLIQVCQTGIQREKTYRQT